MVMVEEGQEVGSAVWREMRDQDEAWLWLAPLVALCFHSSGKPEYEASGASSSCLRRLASLVFHVLFASFHLRVPSPQAYRRCTPHSLTLLLPFTESHRRDQEAAKIRRVWQATAACIHQTQRPSLTRVLRSSTTLLLEYHKRTHAD